MEDLIKNQLKALASIQDIDTNLHMIKLVKGSLPAELQSIESELSEIEELISKSHDKIETYKQQIAREQKTSEDKRMLLEKYQNQKPSIQNKEESDAIQKQIELLSLEIQLYTKKHISLNSLINETISMIGEKEASKSLVLKKLAEKKSELELISLKYDEQEKKLMEDRKKYIPLIDSDLLVRYDRLRSIMQNGLGAVKVSRGACGACFMVITTQKQIDVASNETIERCDYCGTILLDASLDEISETGYHTLIHSEEDHSFSTVN